jgi:hypothetical protein
VSPGRPRHDRLTSGYQRRSSLQPPGFQSATPGGGIGSVGPSIRRRFPRRCGRWHRWFLNSTASTLVLSGGFGEVRLGRDYTPTFWNHSVLHRLCTNGSGQIRCKPLSFLGSGTTTGVRANNSISYFTPTIATLSPVDGGTEARARPPTRPTVHWRARDLQRVVSSASVATASEGSTVAT